MKLKTKLIIFILFYFAVAFIYTGLTSGVAYLPVALIGLVIGYFAWKYMKRKQAEAEAEEQEQPIEQLPQSSPSEPNRNFNLVAVEEDDEDDEGDDNNSFSIKGINFANLDDSFLGDHDGYIKAITDNPKDPNAIAVYVGKKRVGWLPAGNSQLHSQLLSIGGKAKVLVLISKAYDSTDNRPFYYGKAVIPSK